MEIRGFEPRASRMRSGRSTAELYPRAAKSSFKLSILTFFLPSKTMHEELTKDVKDQGQKEVHLITVEERNPNDLLSSPLL